MTPRAHTTLRRACRAAFTLIELLIVVTLFAIFAAVTVPSLVNANTPLPQVVGDTLEVDLRRARIEAIARMEPVVLVVGAERDRWWLARQDAPETALDCSTRIFGSGLLSSYAGYRIGLSIGNGPAASGDVVLATFDEVGSRDANPIKVDLTMPQSETLAGRWLLAEGHTKFTETDQRN